MTPRKLACINLFRRFFLLIISYLRFLFIWMKMNNFLPANKKRQNTLIFVPHSCIYLFTCIFSIHDYNFKKPFIIFFIIIIFFLCCDYYLPRVIMRRTDRYLITSTGEKLIKLPSRYAHKFAVLQVKKKKKSKDFILQHILNL